MKKLELAFWVVLLFFVHAQTVFAQKAMTVNGEAIIRLHPASDVDAFARRTEEAFGINGGFGISRCLIPTMDIWLVHFNGDTYNLDEALYLLRNDAAIMIAQANHAIEERIIPDDPLFELQWHHEQASDHDID
ncbi:MAG: hypothetical protein ACKOSR_11110, partial [Flavobacteriales bacterium]